MQKPGTDLKFYRPELDGLRFFAFFLVFLHHLPVPNGYVVPPTFMGSIFNLHLHGWMGVDLFFCLSAYLITKLLYLEWKSTNRVSLKDFYIRRILRIWPLYYFACLLGFLIFPLLGWFNTFFGDAAFQTTIHTYLWPYLLLVGNWVISFHSYSSYLLLLPLWTIPLEEQYYFVGPLLLVLTRFKKRSVLKLSLFFLAFTAAARVAALMMGSPYPTIWVCTLTRLDPFVLGTCLALFEDELIRFSQKFSAAGFGLAGLALLVNIVLFMDYKKQTTSLVWQYFLMDLGFCCLIFSITRIDSLKRFFSHWVFVHLGKISYGLYVYHIWAYYLAGLLIQWMMVHWYLRFTVFDFEAVNLTVGLAFSIGISILSYHCFEKLFLKLKRRYTAIESRPV